MRRVDDGVKIRGHRAQNVGPSGKKFKQIEPFFRYVFLVQLECARVSSTVDRAGPGGCKVTLLNETGPQLSFRKSGVVPVLSLGAVGLTCTHVTNAVLRAHVSQTQCP
jgi:hypothetical protein